MPCGTAARSRPLWMTVSQILSEIKGRNAGYGMQIYCGKDMEPTRKEEEGTPPTTPDTPYTLTESQISKLATADNPAEGVELSTQSFIINHQSLDTSHTYEKEIPIPCTGATCTNKNYLGDYICNKSEHDCSTDHSCSGTAKNPCSRYHKHTNACKQWVCGGHGITIDYITHSMSLDDKLTTLKLAQAKTYPLLIADSEFKKNSLSPDPRTTTTQYQDTLQGYEYNFIIQRGKDDKLNLYSGITNPKTSLSTPSKLYNFTASKAQKSSIFSKNHLSLIV